MNRTVFPPLAGPSAWPSRPFRRRRTGLGFDATAVEGDVVVAGTQQGPRQPRMGNDTYVRRLVKEETGRLEDAQFERWKR